mmetsp:Transcript_6747/g.18206  ORF Transcript_6747/g.18206 Transcript_6747/m.18206 type:complete len:225 (-) Transcript_6747:262-936(-)
MPIIIRVRVISLLPHSGEAGRRQAHAREAALGRGPSRGRGVGTSRHPAEGGDARQHSPLGLRLAQQPVRVGQAAQDLEQQALVRPGALLVDGERALEHLLLVGGGARLPVPLCKAAECLDSLGASVVLRGHLQVQHVDGDPAAVALLVRDLVRDQLEAVVALARRLPAVRGALVRPAQVAVSGEDDLVQPGLVVRAARGGLAPWLARPREWGHIALGEAAVPLD